MARKAATAAEGSVAASTGLNDGELRFIKAVFDNMTQKPDADWDKVANDLGLKDAKCAKERFRQMSVRHGWRTTQGPGSANPSPAKAKRPAAGSVGDEKPAKKPRAPRKKVVKKEEEVATSSDSEVKKCEDEDAEVKPEAVDTEDEMV